VGADFIAKSAAEGDTPLMATTGMFIVHIPYRGSAPAFTDLLAGQVQMMAESIPQASQ
jgi:tripartite-type tricarboxylate transporter receptor subunit TctC